MNKFILLTDSVNDVFGNKITPPTGIPNGGTNPLQAIGDIFSTGIKLFIFVASMVLLAFLLWGALDWIMSGGDKEKVAKAQQKITNALIGFIAIFVIFTLFGVITGDILGIVQRSENGGWIFNLPRLNGNN